MITHEEMLQQLGPVELDFKTGSKIKKEDLIEYLYYQKKMNEVFDRYYGYEWTMLLRDLYNWRHRIQE